MNWHRMSVSERNRHRALKHQKRWESAAAVSKPRWEAALRSSPVLINLGGRIHCNGHIHFRGWWSVDRKPFRDHVIAHDLRTPLPIGDETVDQYLTEHFMEHIEIDKIRQLLHECWRTLRPGGLLRVAVPDYNHPKHERDLEAGRDLGMAEHLTLWTVDMARKEMAATPFSRVDFRHYWENGRFIAKPIDYSLGHIRRTPEHDPRNAGQDVPPVTSLVFDAWKK